MAVMGYRTKDGLADYCFSIEFQVDGGWRVYVVFQPFRSDTGSGLRLPHQSIDPDGRRYVNWPSRLDSLGDAKEIAEFWAEHIHQCAQKEKEPTVNCQDRGTLSS